jgi:hypothetical protein
MHMHMQDHNNMSVIYVPHRNKSFGKYRWRMYNQWQITLMSVVSSSGMTYENVVSVPAEEHNWYIITYITPYPLSATRAFNDAWTTLYTLRERIHVLRKRPQDIPKSPHPRCAVMASHTTDTQPLLRNRDCPQASLILKGRVRDSHHPTGVTYLLIFSSVHHYRKVNCIKLMQKVNPS